MSREMCYRCFWPKPLCWCASLVPMPTKTKFVFLMHPKEFKEEKAGTGRLTHLCLPNSEIHMGMAFDQVEPLQSILRDDRNVPLLLYPGPAARNLSKGELSAAEIGGKQLVILVLDATWSGARKILRLSPSLQQLPRIMFTPTAPSRFVIKQQPAPECLSTLEATHEVLLALARSGLDEYPLPAQLLEVFGRMQDFQIRCALDPNRGGYRRQPYSDPASRTGPRGKSGSRRTRMFRAPDLPASVQESRPT